MKKLLLIFISFILLSGCGREKYDVNKTKTDKFDQLTFEVPSFFERGNMESDSSNESLVFSDFNYKFEKMDTNGKFDDTCYITFFYDKVDENSYNYNYSLEEYASIYQENANGVKKIINGVQWFIVEQLGTEKSATYIYYSKYNNKFYQLSYSKWGNNNICEDAKEVIENSLKFE